MMCKENYDYEKERKTWCYICKEAEMKWDGDFSFEDYGLDGKGIISNLSCPKCGATAEFYTKIDE